MRVRLFIKNKTILYSIEKYCLQNLERPYIYNFSIIQSIILEKRLLPVRCDSFDIFYFVNLFSNAR